MGEKRIRYPIGKKVGGIVTWGVHSRRAATAIWCTFDRAFRSRSSGNPGPRRRSRRRHTADAPHPTPTCPRTNRTALPPSAPRRPAGSASGGPRGRISPSSGGAAARRERGRRRRGRRSPGNRRARRASPASAACPVDPLRRLPSPPRVPAKRTRQGPP